MAESEPMHGEAAAAYLTRNLVQRVPRRASRDADVEDANAAAVERSHQANGPFRLRWRRRHSISPS
jgi:hypothetical protein